MNKFDFILECKDWNLKVRLINAIKDFPGANITLEKLLEDENHHVRTEAIDALAKCKESYHLISKSLKDQNEFVVMSAIKALSNSKDYIPIIREMYENDDPYIRETVIDAITFDSDSDSEKLIVSGLRDPNSRVRAASIWALVFRNKNKYYPELRKLVIDKNSEVACAAMNVLSADKEAAFLAKQNLCSSDYYVKKGAIGIISGYHDLVNALVPLLEDEDIRIRCAVIAALGPYKEFTSDIIERLRFAEERYAVMKALASNEALIDLINNFLL